ncbi:MAG: arsenate reductase ArsC [Pyrinomonadaceae bacterium]
MLMKEKPRILILCTGNSARSQMAEGILNHICGDTYLIDSAGTHPSNVRPEAIAVLGEIGIDISGNRSKSVDEFVGQKIDYVLTVCDNAKENCLYFPADARLVHHAFDDPAIVEGSEENRLSAFRAVRDEISSYLRKDFVKLLDRA